MAAKTKAVTKPAKGTRDFLAEELRRREHVIGVIRDVYAAHGFEPLETPTFERLDTLLGKYGDEGDQLVFKILHRGQNLVDGIRSAAAELAEPGVIVVGRSGETAPSVERLLADLGLRYDLTVPLARVVAEYAGKLPTPYRRFQIQPVWRADTPGKGRFREFHQCDVDVVGTASRVAEAEVCGAVAQALERLGFDDFEIRLNHRQLLSAVVEASGVAPEREVDAIVALDKLDKVGVAGVHAELVERGVAVDAATRLLDAVGGARGWDDLGPAVANVERGAAALDDLRQIEDLAAETPAGPRLSPSPTLARGLGYYTGAIFEIAVRDLAGSLGGGGRYDGLVGMFSGRDLPACGFSIGLERILVVMEARGMFGALDGAADVLIAPLDAGLERRCLRLARGLRAAGLRVEVAPGKDKAGRVRKSADARGLRHAVLVRADRDDAVLVWSREAPDVTDRWVEEGALDGALAPQRAK
jgi:histidyl-tRNA synthetase